MWIVMYNGITGVSTCEPYTEQHAYLLAFMSRDMCVPNDAWFII